MLGHGALGQIAVEKGRWGTCRVALLTIIKEEFDEVQAVFASPNWRNIRSTYYSPDDATLDVVVTQSSGQGHLPAMGSTQKLVERYRPEVVIVVGICGGIEGREDVAPGDVVVPHYLHYGEYAKYVPGAELARHFPYDQPAVSIHESYTQPVAELATWQTRLGAVAPPHNANNHVIRDKAIVGVDKVMGDPDHEAQQRIIARFNDAVAVDMESIGVARAVSEERVDVLYNPRLLVVRGVSDLLRQRSSGPRRGWRRRRSGPQGGPTSNQAERDQWRRYAARVAAAFAFEVTERILNEEADLRQEIRR